MKRYFAYIIFTLFVPALLLAQEPHTLSQLNIEQQQISHKLDSINTLLSHTREQVPNASGSSRDSLAQVIVSLEGELFGLKAHLSRVGGDIAAIEEQNAINGLEMSSENSNKSGLKLYEVSPFSEHLSKVDEEVLSQANDLILETAATKEQAIKLYNSLVALKTTYDISTSQSELDHIIVTADSIKSALSLLDANQGEKWLESYNHILGLLLVMLDSSPSVDRTQLEKLESNSRNVRRDETFMQQGSLCPNLAVFELQVELLMGYEKVVILSANTPKLRSIFPKNVESTSATNFADIDFAERILYVYSPIVKEFEYASSNIADIPRLLLPPRGVYYAIQVALLSDEPSSLKMLRGVGPVQVEITDEKKYRYLIGGYKTYKEAQQGVKELYKVGFRAPKVVGYLDGEITDVKKCQIAEKEGVSTAGAGAKFRVILTTTDANIGDMIRTTIDMNYSGKSVARATSNGEIIFTITEFDTKEEAEVFGEILKQKSNEDNIKVEQISI